MPMAGCRDLVQSFIKDTSRGLSQGNCKAILKGHTSWLEDVVITADSRNALTGSRDATVMYVHHFLLFPIPCKFTIISCTFPIPCRFTIISSTFHHYFLYIPHSLWLHHLPCIPRVHSMCVWGGRVCLLNWLRCAVQIVGLVERCGGARFPGPQQLREQAQAVGR